MLSLKVFTLKILHAQPYWRKTLSLTHLDQHTRTLTQIDAKDRKFTCFAEVI